MKLDEPVEYSDYVSPICLPTMTVYDPDSRKGIAATLIGWGASNTITPKLKETSVKIFSQKYCNYTREGQRRPRNLQNLFQDDLLCAGKFTINAMYL